MTLGVVLAELNSTFYTTIISSMEEKLREAGYGTIICDSRGSAEAEAEAIHFLIGKMVDGIVIMPVGDEVAGLAAAAERGVPVVAVDRAIANAAVDTVVIDNRAAIASAVDLLAEAGHVDIGLLAGPDTTFTMRERRLGFREAVKRHTGRLPRRTYTQPDPVTIQGGYVGLRRLLALEPAPDRRGVRQLRVHRRRDRRHQRTQPTAPRCRRSSASTTSTSPGSSGRGRPWSPNPSHRSPCAPRN